MSHRPHKCNDCGAEIDSGARCSSCQEAKDRREWEGEERRRREAEGR